MVDSSLDELESYSARKGWLKRSTARDLVERLHASVANESRIEQQAKSITQLEAAFDSLSLAASLSEVERDELEVEVASLREKLAYERGRAQEWRRLALDHDMQHSLTTFRLTRERDGYKVLAEQRRRLAEHLVDPLSMVPAALWLYGLSAVAGALVGRG